MADKNVEGVEFTPRIIDDEQQNVNNDELSDVIRRLNDRINKLEARIKILES